MPRITTTVAGTRRARSAASRRAQGVARTSSSVNVVMVSTRISKKPTDRTPAALMPSVGGNPAAVVVILGMTYRFLFLLLASAHDLFLARRSRGVGKLPPAEARKLFARTTGVLLSKTMATSQQVYLAMVSRGFTGDARLLDPLAMRGRDGVAVAASLGLSAIAIWAGR